MSTPIMTITLSHRHWIRHLAVELQNEKLIDKWFVNSFGVIDVRFMRLFYFWKINRFVIEMMVIVPVDCRCTVFRYDVFRWFVDAGGARGIATNDVIAI